MQLKVKNGKLYKLIYRCPVCKESGKPGQPHPECRSRCVVHWKLVYYSDKSYDNDTYRNIFNKIKNYGN